MNLCVNWSLPTGNSANSLGPWYRILPGHSLNKFSLLIVTKDADLENTLKQRGEGSMDTLK